MEIYRSVEGAVAIRAQYISLLARWPAGSEQLRLPTSAGETFVVASGPATAPPVLLLQGSGANAAMWLSEVPALARHHRVFAVDVIGEPGFSAPSRPSFASAAYSEWLRDVVDGLGLTRASMVGVSLGGWLVLDFATRYPDRVDRLMVINPAGLGRQRASLLFKMLPLMLCGRWGRRRAMAIATGLAAGAASRMDPEVGRLVILIARHFNRRRVRLPLFTDDQLRRLPAPLLAILGARDAMLRADQTRERLERLVPGAVIRWLDEGHVISDGTALVSLLNQSVAAWDRPGRP